MAERPGYVEAALGVASDRRADFCLSECGYRKLYSVMGGEEALMSPEECAKIVKDSGDLKISCGIAGVAVALTAERGGI